MTALTIPNPIPISCTDCHRTMRVEFQEIDEVNDATMIAAECRCGRVIGRVPGRTLFALRSGRPILRSDIDRDLGDVGEEATRAIERYRSRIAAMERLISAATWANGGRKP